MTLIISAVSAKGVWQVSDRRLINPETREVFTDSAIKVVRLDFTDAKACVGYSGIGSVADQEISKWMQRLLIGRRRSYREVRNLLAASASEKLSPLVGTTHEFSIVAIIDGRPHFEVLAVDRDQQYWKGGTAPGQFGSWTPHSQIRRCVYFSGSGRVHLNRSDQRVAVRALKRKATTPEQLEAALVYLHRVAYSKPASPTISRDCICTHINAEGGGWSHLHHANGQSTIAVPTIAAGLPVDVIAKEILEIEGPELAKALKENRKPSPHIDRVNEALRQIRTTPDDSLPWEE